MVGRRRTDYWLLLLVLVTLTSEWFVDLCSFHAYVIGGAWFDHRAFHKVCYVLTDQDRFDQNAVGSKFRSFGCMQQKERRLRPQEGVPYDSCLSSLALLTVHSTLSAFVIRLGSTISGTLNSLLGNTYELWISMKSAGGASEWEPIYRRMKLEAIIALWETTNSRLLNLAP